MILNTGSRTDIPAFYSNWFYRRVEEEFVLVRNPYSPLQVTRYRISPEVVDCLVFCTKNPRPMFDKLDRLKAFHQYWYVTITPYGKEIEPFVPPVSQVIESFKWLSAKVGLSSIGWRYDPIFLYGPYTLDFHLKSFQSMAEALKDYTDNCVISFIDLYQKTKRNFSAIQAVSSKDRMTLGQAFAQIGRRYGITIRSCCEGTELEAFGIDCSGCLTQPILEKAAGGFLTPPRQKAAREGCSCLLGSDIGAYNTCGHGCLYCYANESMDLVRRNQALHDPKSPYLLGHGFPEDHITNGEQKSWFDGQLRLF